ncbi:hypothetical protein BG004_003463 [Podila humilis]|nr:hypothetical protein BG004_003463 [Podila humilis]
MPDIPAIDAIFITRFDTRQGNLLQWCVAVPDMTLDNVEYASLPSGLHNTPEDVIYFRLEGCMGLAVYLNVQSDRAEHRGAQMVSLGILVRPSPETGRCGQVWRHIEFLKSQVRSCVDKDANTEVLSAYFNAHKTQPQPPLSPGSSSNTKRDSYRSAGRRRANRSFTLSEPVAALSRCFDVSESQEPEEIPASHPSHFFLEHVLAMGPSIFVLWKAALLKKRILIYTPPPVENACLAGIHDMDSMMKSTSGYVACTTDKLFLFKPQLFDVLVQIPPISPLQDMYYELPKQIVPRISTVRETGGGERYLKEVSGPHLIDNRRYFALFQQMSRSKRRQSTIQRRLRAESSNMGCNDHTVLQPDSPNPWRGAYPEHNDSRYGDLGDNDALHSDERTFVSKDIGFRMSDTLKKMVTGGWWWWYGSDEDEEEFQPFLQEEAACINNSHSRDATTQDGESILPEQRLSGAHLQILQRPHADSDTEAIRFFHNLTQTLLLDLGRLLSYKETAAIFSEEGENVVEITKDDIRDLGLDPLHDSEFVQELCEMYFGTKVTVPDAGFLWGCSQVFCCQICR